MNRRILPVVILAAVTSSQFSVAAPPIDPDEARPHVSSADAKNVIGKLAFVSGKVKSVRKAGAMTLIEFGDGDRAEFVGLIQPDQLSNFSTPPADLYTGKLVTIRGIVKTYRGRPEILVMSPDQVKILTELPESKVPAAAPEVPQKSTIRIAAYNIMNLYDDVDDEYFWDEGTPAKSREQLETLAASIRKLNADVLSLEELEGRGYLERFLEVFLSDMGYKHVVQFEGNDDRGIDVGLISRVPIGQVTSNRHITFPGPNGEPQRFARDILEVTVQPAGGKEIEVWVVHLTSNFEGREYAEPFRLAECRELRRMLDKKLEQDPEARLIVMGDFNDTFDSESLKTIVGSGPKAMWSVSQDHEGEPPITYNQEPYLTMIDFMLCSPTMAKAYVDDSFHVELGSPEKTGSDHNPVVAEFRLE